MGGGPWREGRISSQGVRATRPGPADLDALRGLLEEDVEQNLFLLDILSRGGIVSADEQGLWLAAKDDAGALIAVLYAAITGKGRPASTAVPWGPPDACRMLGAWLAHWRGTRMIVGPREACDAVWEGLGAPPPLTRFNQRLYICDSPPTGDRLPVSLAEESDLDALAEMHAQMLHEDLGIAIEDIEPTVHRGQVLWNIRIGRTWIHRDASGAIAFTIRVGTHGPLGAQVGGTFVPPALRGQGISTRCMRDLNARLLRDVPRVSLHVNEANLAAVRCYENAGYRRAAAFRLMVL